MIQSASGPANLILLKPLSKPLRLAVGDTLQAEVTDMFPPDGVTLRLNGIFIPARATVPLERGTTVMLKVMSLDEKTGQVSLQFLGPSGDRAASATQASTMPGGARFQAIDSLLDELSELLVHQPSGNSDNRGSEANNQAATPGAATAQNDPDSESLERAITRLIKSLPLDTASLPAGLKGRLQEVLHRSLGASAVNIYSRMEALLKSLPGEMKTAALTGAIRSGLALTVDAFPVSDLRHAIEDTGVLLEAKLRAIVRSAPDPASAARRIPGGADAEQACSPSRSQRTAPPGEYRQDTGDPELKGDLKAHLLLLRQVLIEGREAPQGKTLLRSLATSLGFEFSESAGPHHGTLHLIDGILRDIETYQLLSKATESFHTFLPVLWDNLRDGEISFRKKTPGSSRAVYSCRLTLNLERLGMLSAIIVMQNDRFTVAFKADQPGLREALTAHLHDLEDAFQLKGLPLTRASVADADDRSFDGLDAAWSLDAGLSVKV